MTENVKGLAMRYKHDGIVYELDSGKLVHTTGEQSIDGKKVFSTVPQVEGAPVEDNDVTNKKYVQDALDAFAAPKVASFTITATNSANGAQGAAPVEINKLKIFLADGRRLDPVFMEEGDLKGSTEAKLLVLTLNKQDQSDLTPTKVAKTEIESYALKDGEFLGKLYPCKFFGQHQDMYSNSNYQDPWNQYWTTADRFWDQETTTSGQVRIDIFDIDQMVQKLSFTSTSSGREAVFTATANDGAKEENGDVQKKENHVFDIVFPKMGEMLSKPGPVLLSTNQVVKDVKTFATPPKSANAPVSNDDVANKAYVDNLNNELKGYVDGLIQKPGFDIELQIGVTALTSWNAFSQLNILLNNGKRLEAKYVEEGVKAGSDPAKVVLVMTDNPDAEIPGPELKQASFFDTYELGSNEYACDFYNATAMGLGTIHSNPLQANPWRAYLVSGISSGQKGYYLKLVIKQLQDAVSTVQFYCGDKHNGYGYPPKNFIFKASCNGVTTDEQVSKDNPSTKELIKFDIPADALPMGDNYVDLVSEQTINGVKTFAAVPKITAEPTEDTDAVNKKYIEEHFVSRPPKYDFKIEITCEGNSSYVAYSELKINLTGGKVIEPLYLEKRETRPDNNIYRFVYKISDASAVTVKQTPRKTSSEMDAYQLQDGEYIGHLYYAGHFSSATVMNAYDNQTDPWYGYLFQGGSGKLTMCQIILSDLPTDVTGIAFKSGDKRNSFGYKSAKYGAKFTYGKKSQEHELTNAQATHEFLVDSNALAPEAGNSGFVELAGDQSINGVKTFLTPPKSVKAPTDAKDIANKAYVDNRLGAGFDVAFTIKQAFSNAWGGLSKLHVELAKGVLEAKYVEDVMPANAREPALIVWTTKSTATKDPQVTYKSKEDIKGYKLQDGEYLGDITYAELLGPYKTHTSTDYRCPFDSYLYNGGSLGQKPIIKVNIYSLKQAVKSVRYLNGYNGSSYVGADNAVDFVVNNVESTSSLTGAGTSDDAPFVFTPTVKTLFDNEKSNYVPIKGDANIFDVKTFSKPPKSLAEAVEDNDLVTKAYVDSKSSSPDKLPVQEVTVFTKAASNNTILMNFLLLDTVDGTHVDPIYYEEKTAYYNLQEPLRVIFSVNAERYVNSSYTNVNPQQMETRDMDNYELKEGEFMGSISLPNLVSGGKVDFANTSNNLPWSYFKVTTNGATEDTPVLKIKIEGKLPAVAKASFQADTTYPGEDFKLAVTAGGITKESEVKRAVAGEVLNLTCTEVPIYEDYYVNTLSNQSIMGTKVFKNAPQYLNLAPVARNNGDNLVNFANLASSIGIAVPEKQTLGFGVEGRREKIHVGGARWNYSWSMNVKFEKLVPAFIDPLTGKITPLYIKHYCSDGRAILTTTKPSVEFDRGSVTSKSSDEMDSYTLAQGEYLCKAYWYFLAQYQNTNITGTYIKNNNICGSKVLDLFTTSSDYWKEYQSGQFNDASNYVSPMSSLYVEFYNTPEIRYVRAYGVSCNSVDHSPFGLEDKVTQAEKVSASLNSSTFQELGEYQRANFALNAPTSPVEMLPVAPIVANMQATIEKLEARIKTLEDAANP